MGSLFKSPKAPTPVDPRAAIAAQEGANRNTAALGASYNRVNQTDPFGNTLNYSQSGTDAQGNPVFQANQQLGETGQAYAGGLAGLGQQYFQGANELLDNRPDLSSNAAFDRAYQTASANLEPRFQRAGDALDSRLRNQGLDPSSEAYRNSSNDLALQQNEARNNLVTNLQGQLFNQGQQDRQNQVSELQSLTNPGIQFGNTVLNPSYAQVPQVNVGSTDAMGAYNNNFNQQMGIYNQQVGQRNAMLGGLGGIGGSLLGLPMGGGTSLGGSLFQRAFS